MEFFSVTLDQLKKACFPLNHDCVLKVCYIANSPLRFQYFTCRAQDCGKLVLILSQLSLVRQIESCSVEDLKL